MKVLIIGNYPEAAKRLIRACMPEEWELALVPPEDLDGEIGTADVLIPEHVRVDAALLEKAPRLKLVQTGAGYDNVKVGDCTAHGVQVCCAAGVNAAAVAEHVMAFILAYYKNLVYLDTFMKARRPECRLSYQGAEISGKAIGIIGFGKIGRKVADFCHAFGMRVLVCGGKNAGLSEYESVSLDELYRESDIISVHVPLTDATKQMVGADAFRKMKKDALLINTSRGGVIQEAALIQALRDAQIGGACLDVYEEEPLPPDSPLRDFEQVILTPHTAGLPDGVKFHRKRYEFFVSNIRRVMNHEPPECRLNEVSFSV